MASEDQSHVENVFNRFKISFAKLQLKVSLSFNYNSKIVVNFALIIWWAGNFVFKMYIKDIKDACRRLLQGDKKVLEQLGLNDAKYPIPKPQNTWASSLQLHYNATLNTAVAARELQLPFMEKQCKLSMEYIQAIAAAKKITLEHSVDSEDVAEIMLSLIDLDKRKYWKEGDEHKDSESEEEEESELDEGEKEKDKVDEAEKEEDKVDEVDEGEKEDKVDESEKEDKKEKDKVDEGKK